MTPGSTEALSTPPKAPATPALPPDLGACHAMIAQLIEQLRKSQQDHQRLEHQFQRRMYGHSAEKLDAHQMALFAGMLEELKAPAAPAAEPTPAPAPVAPARGHGRRRLPADLPRQRIVHDLPGQERPCPCCGKTRIVIGEELSEQLDFEPAKLSVIEHVRLKYACPACEKQAQSPQITTAQKPLSPIEKGLAAPGLLAYVIVSKYSDHLPLHRLERILKRHQIDLARSTLGDWAAQSAEALAPLYQLMVRDVLGSRILWTDDTPVDVLDPTIKNTRTGRFWVYLGDPAHPQAVFVYTPSRSRDGPMRFLSGWGKDQRVYLQADAFGGYDCIYAGLAGGQVIEVACWAHTRRYFYEARTSDVAASAQALAYIRLLYDVEDLARQRFERQAQAPGALPLAAVRLALRQELAVPRLAEFKAWLDAQRGSVLPQSPMGQAITYALNQWDALNVYVSDGELTIDNNASENALRRIAVGRANWNFCGSDKGGATAAVLYSFIATCERHQVEPWAYLRDVLARIPATLVSQLGQLLCRPLEEGRRLGFCPHRGDPRLSPPPLHQITRF